jgi:hypothetical protein
MGLANTSPIGTKAPDVIASLLTVRDAGDRQVALGRAVAQPIIVVVEPGHVSGLMPEEDDGAAFPERLHRRDLRIRTVLHVTRLGLGVLGKGWRTRCDDEQGGWEQGASEQAFHFSFPCWKR